MGREVRGDSMSDRQLRSNLIRLASELPKGSSERRKILAVLQDKTAANSHRASGKRAALGWQAQLVDTGSGMIQLEINAPAEDEDAVMGSLEKFFRWVKREGEVMDWPIRFEVTEVRGEPRLHFPRNAGQRMGIYVGDAEMQKAFGPSYGVGSDLDRVEKQLKATGPWKVFQKSY